MIHLIRRTGRFALVVAILGASTGVQAQDEIYIEEILVTAQKRVQNLQDVPVAVTAYSGQMLQDSAIKDMRELAAIAPSLRSNQSQNSTTASFGIRGIGTSTQNFGLESSVGIYVDGVYRSRQSAAINNLVDIEAVEVLRGPQGTLFGKNTLSGALNIRTAKPDHERNGFIEVTGGDYNLVNMSAAGNLSLIEDVLAARATVFTGNRDGFVDELNAGENVLNDRDRFGGRLQLLYTPIDELEVRLIADYAEIDEVCCAALTLFNNFVGFGGVLGSDSGLVGLLGVPVIGADRFDDNIMALNRLPRSTNEDKGLSLEFSLDIGNATLTSISAYRAFDSTDLIDADFSAGDLLFDENLSEQSSFSQELRVAGAFGESGNYLAGVYFFSQDLDNVSTLTLGEGASTILPLNPLLVPLNPIIDGINALSELSGGLFPLVGESFPAGAFATDAMRQEHESVAVFGQLDFNLSDNFVVTAGLRFTDEQKSMSGQFLNSPLGPPLDIPAAIAVGTGIQIWSINPALPGALDPTNPANLPAIFAGFGPFWSPGWGAYLFPALAPQGPLLAEIDDNQITGTFKLSWFATDNMMLYASFGTGYKSGGTNTDRINPIFSQTFGPESSEAIEIGMKADFPAANVRVNIALHDTQIEDLQTNAFTGAGFNLQNAGNADTKGGEIDLWWQPTELFELQLSYAHNKADFENFLNGTCWVATPFLTGRVDPGFDPSQGPFSPTSSTCDRSGDRVSSNPEDSFYAGLQQSFRLGSATRGYIRAEYSYLSDTMTDGNNEPLKLRPSFDFIHARVGLEFEELGTDLSFWVRNATDERFYETVFDVPTQDGKLNAYPHEPRTWGITVRKHFD